MKIDMHVYLFKETKFLTSWAEPGVPMDGWLDMLEEVERIQVKGLPSLKELPAVQLSYALWLGWYQYGSDDTDLGIEITRAIDEELPV